MAKIQLPIDLQVLRAFFDYCSGGLSCHPPIRGITKHLPRELKNNLKPVKKSVKRLVANGYLIEHPTKGDTTYNLSPYGRNYILNS